MQGFQAPIPLQLLKGRCHRLGAEIGIQEFALHAGGGMADQLQSEGFDAGCMEAAEHMEDAHSVRRYAA
jgi:hypothetical protein